jgi:hypothetical protein
MAWLVAACSLLAAPVPRAKEKKRPPVAGAWVAYWNRQPWQTLMLDCGGYFAERADPEGVLRYEGEWSLKGDELVIRERTVAADGLRGFWFTYRFTLKPGKLEAADGTFKLAKE